MIRTRVKICGVMRADDARLAAAAGADAVGVVLYPQARRFVPVDRAREILAALPAFVTPVGMFVDQPAEEVRETARAVGLRHVQLHGHESADIVASLGEFAVIKAVRASRETLAAEISEWRAAIKALGLQNLKGCVLETPTTAGPGGTGVENDWGVIEEAIRAGVFDGLPPMIVAGGLRIENVRAVVERLRPYAVDVSSGVEETLGEKSAERIGAFIAEVGRARSR
jgi:phosphoribosylanthranilate isomerase